MPDLIITFIVIILTAVIVIGIFYFANKTAIKSNEEIKIYCTQHNYKITEEEIEGGSQITVSSEGWTLRSERVKLYHDAADASVNWRYFTRTDIEYASGYKYIIGIIDSSNGGTGMDYNKLPETIRSMIEKKVLEELNLSEQISMPCFSNKIGKNQYLIFAENQSISDMIAEHYQAVLGGWPSDRRIVVFSDGKSIKVESNNLYMKTAAVLDTVIQIVLRAKEL